MVTLAHDDTLFASDVALALQVALEVAAIVVGAGVGSIPRNGGAVAPGLALVGAIGGTLALAVRVLAVVRPVRVGKYGPAVREAGAREHEQRFQRHIILATVSQVTHARSDLQEIVDLDDRGRRRAAAARDTVGAPTHTRIP